jgi:hypothetical protein
MDEVDVIQFSLALKQNKNLQSRVNFWRESLDFAGNLLQTYDNFMDMTLEIKDGFDLEEQGYQAPASAEWLPPRQATGR